MDALLQSQQLQLKLIRSASVNENCAFDLMGIVHQLTLAEGKNVLGIIEVLLNEAESLRRISKDVAARPVYAMSC